MDDVLKEHRATFRKLYGVEEVKEDEETTDD